MLAAAQWSLIGMTTQGEPAFAPPGLESWAFPAYLFGAETGAARLSFQEDYGPFTAGKDYAFDTVRRMLTPDASDHAALVEDELRRQRARRDARRQLDAETAGTVTLPAPARLDEFLAVVDHDPEYRVDGLLPTGGNALLAAQHKAGKSTLIANLIRSIVDGDPFLDRHTASSGTVTLVDDELDPRTLRRWLAEQGIQNTAAVSVVSLRGRVSSFDLLNEQTRTLWAQQLGGADLLIIDCLRPILDALSLDENHDAGRMLVAFDELKAEAGISELIVVHHMGHAGERSRGDSRILDWPDAIWKIVRERPDDADSPRYFSAFGRDVDVKETRLDYDHGTRRLVAAGESRRMAAIDHACNVVADFLGEEEHKDGLTQYAIETALKESGVPRSDVREALSQLQKRGRTVVVPAARNAKKHVLLPDLASSPQLAATSPASTPATSPPPLYRGGEVANSISEQQLDLADGELNTQETP